jgi:hypothetical protein
MTNLPLSDPATRAYPQRRGRTTTSLARGSGSAFDTIVEILRGHEATNHLTLTLS